MVENCHHCQIHRPVQHAEPLNPRLLPEKPLQRISADLLEQTEKMYMVMVDEFSRWIEIIYNVANNS